MQVALHKQFVGQLPHKFRVHKLRQARVARQPIPLRACPAPANLFRRT